MKYLLCLVILFALNSHAALIDFEGQLDGTSLLSQYPSITFSHTTVLTAGLSLNEFDFPPKSGANAVFDDGGPIGISFAAPVLSFSGYFTYTTRVNLSFYDALSHLLGTVSSAYANNTGGGAGDPFSSPNEFLSYSSASGIASVIAQGDLAGGSLVLDDLSYQASAGSGVPEPATVLTTLATLMVVVLRRRAQ